MRSLCSLLLLALVAGLAAPPCAPGADVRLADGVRLHCRTSGTGPIPVVLVHGYGMSSEVWERVLPLFPPEYRLHALDLRGFGRSDQPEGGYACAELAEDVGAFMDALGIGRAVLIGHSFGGLVLQHFAARHPGRVMALVLSNTFAAALPPRGLTPAVEARIHGYGSAEDNRRVFAAAVPRYFDGANVTGADIARFVAVGLQAGNRALRETLKANYTTPAIPAAQHAALSAPVLIVLATHDPFGTFDQAVAMSDAWPDSRIRVITRSGHSPMWERPAAFGQTVLEFLAGANLR